MKKFISLLVMLLALAGTITAQMKKLLITKIISETFYIVRTSRDLSLPAYYTTIDL